MAFSVSIVSDLRRAPTFKGGVWEELDELMNQLMSDKEVCRTEYVKNICMFVCYVQNPQVFSSFFFFLFSENH